MLKIQNNQPKSSLTKNERRMPLPTAAPVKSKNVDPVAEAYLEMAEMEERAIVAAMRGQEVGPMIYTYPVRDKNAERQKAPFCNNPKCKSRNKEPHGHVFGISVDGANELARMSWGFRATIVDVKIVNKNGKKYWQALAFGTDRFSIYDREAIGECEYDKPFGETIARNRAEKNVILKLAPQRAKSTLKKMAEMGKETFEEKDVSEAFSSLWTERKMLKEQAMNAYFNAMTGRQDAAIKTCSSMPAAALPVGQSSAKEPNRAISDGTSANGSGREGHVSQSATGKQCGFLKGILRNSGHEDVNFRALLAWVIGHLDCDEKTAASRMIEAFKGKDFSLLNKYQEAQKGEAAEEEAPPASEDGNYDATKDDRPDINWGK